MKAIKPINLSKVTDPELMILINALSCGRYHPSAPAKNSIEYEPKNLTHINKRNQVQSRFSHRKTRLRFSGGSRMPVSPNVSCPHPCLPVCVYPCKSLNQVVEDVEKIYIINRP
jgi:hypothetical protein